MTNFHAAYIRYIIRVKELLPRAARDKARKKPNIVLLAVRRAKHGRGLRNDQGTCLRNTES